MKILIDMQGLQTPFSSRRGVGAYISGIVQELHRLAGKHRIEYMFNAEFPDEFFNCLANFPDIIRLDNSHLFSQRILENYRFAEDEEIHLAEEFLTAFIETIEPDIFFCPNLQEGLDDRAITTHAARNGRFAQFSTLHDVVPLYLRDEYLADPATNRWYRRKLENAVESGKVITVSHSSKSDIEKLVGLKGSRVEAIPNGYDPSLFNPDGADGDDARVNEFLGWSGSYILYYGGSDHHKNLVRLVEGFSTLPQKVRDSHRLVLGGGDIKSADLVLKSISDNRLDGEVLIPGFVSESLLPAVIRKASLFVFPSIYEGFGLPAVEAMACGTATIGSNRSAVSEVIGNRDATFDPDDPADIGRKIQQVLGDEPQRESIREHGLRRANEFSWRTAAARLLALMEQEHEARCRGGKLSFISARLAKAQVTDRALLQRAAATIAETVPDDRSPRIYLDASSVATHGGNSGIQRVVRAICRHLGQEVEGGAASVQVVYASEGETGLRELSSFTRTGLFKPHARADRLVDFHRGDSLVFIDLQPNLAIKSERDLQRLRALGVKVYYVLYDLLPVLMPEKFWPDLQREFYRWLQAVSRADGLICISETVKKEAAAYLARYGVKRPDALKLSHFRLGADLLSAAAPAPADLQSLGIAPLEGSLSFLMVGTLEPRKGHEQTILAFEQLWRENEEFRLVLIGKQGWKMNRLASYIKNHPQFGKKLFWFDSVNDEQLHALYQMNDCVICPSEGEGFGLPLIEAANNSKPVIARDIPVFREVAKDGASFFANDTSPNVIAEQIKVWSKAYAAGSHPSSDAMAPVEWQESAREFGQLLDDPQWDTEVRPRGMVDLRQPVDHGNPNIKSSGFYVPENDFVWSTGNASFEFETHDDYEAVDVQLACFSWKKMRFEVLLNETLVYSGTADTKPGTHLFRLADVPPGPKKLRLRVRDAGTPAGDPRGLGVAVKKFEMLARPPIPLDRWVNALDSRVRWENFSPIEFDWRWTLGKRAFIEFDMEREVEKASMSLFGHAARSVAAKFSVNGEHVLGATIGETTATVELPCFSLVKGVNRVEIHFPDIAQFSNDDRRLLGMAVSDFKLAEIKKAEK